MSLIRQIWLVLVGALLLAFGGSMGVAIVSARDTLQTQLRLKNADNAAALALALSQQKGDPALMELVMAAQFDTGHYRRIRWIADDGRVVFAREAAPARTQAPDGFAALLPIASPPGVAPVSDGWRPLGTVEVVSHEAYAHDELWAASARAAAALAAIGLAAALLARAVVGRIRRSLDATVRQAQALVDGQFATVPEPREPELKRLTRAMNTMVARLKQAFEAQAEQVEALRREAHTDPVTGLANRQHFLRQLAGLLHGEDGTDDGGLVLLRVRDLAGINHLIGREATDRMIGALAQALQAYTQRVPGCRLGRLNGADFALALPAGGVALETAEAVAQALSVVLPSFGHGVSAAVGAVEMRRGMRLAQVMAAADAALARAESEGPFAVGADDAAAHPDAAWFGEGAWRQRIAHAVEAGRLRLVAFPVLDAGEQLLHLECPLRLQLDPGEDFQPAARWLPLALRARLTCAIDERAVALALEAIAGDGRPRGVNLSGPSVSDVAFAGRLRARLRAAPAAARLLWLEVPEAAAVEHFAHVQELAHHLRPSGCHVGLEHVGEGLARLERLFESGLDYVKLDSAFVQGVAGDEGRAHYLQSVVAMLHGLAMTVIAEGVTDPGDAQALWRLGIDGITGPWASRRREDLVAP